MSIFTILYNIFIGPLELFFEIVYSLAYQIIGNPGISIIFLSLAMNFLVLPLYKRADAMQAEERDLEQKLNPWVTHIKKTFKGDERFMMLQTFYRQNNYKPTYVLKGSVSLLLEIPFFIAAYNFLSELEILNGVSFGPIANLGAPDQMIQLGFITLNFLPILMTLVNIVSSAIYTKGMSLKSKIQLYGMAAIFLVFLYNSPAGLVFYWTLNNIFSLVKNIFYKLKNPKFVLNILASISSVFIVIYILFFNNVASLRNKLLVLIFACLLQLPLLLYIIKRKYPFKPSLPATKQDKVIFILLTLIMTILTGALIPSAVINASPEEFINITLQQNPVQYIFHSLTIAIGTFMVWFSVFYALADEYGKHKMSIAMWIITGSSIVNYMFFGKDYGTLSSNLTYVTTPAFSKSSQLLNLGVLFLVFIVLIVLYNKKKELVKAISISICAVAIVMSGFNTYQINNVSKAKLVKIKKDEEKNGKPEIVLSKNGKNVVVLMMDRAISSFLPYAFNEKPELKEQFAGFTYYPNTISFGGHTNFGAPALYGGYEYTPKEMNKRNKELLKDKHNEAMKVMPVLFDKNGFDTTVFDPTYANYNWIPDLSIYDDYPDINKNITMGKFDTYVQENSKHILNRNLFSYSLFKTSPSLLNPTFYDDGNYNDLNHISDHVAESIHKSKGFNENFIRSYSVLENLSSITKSNDSLHNTFLMMSNDTSHSPCILKEPDYIPEKYIDNTEYDKIHTKRFNINNNSINVNDTVQMSHYHVNMAMYIQLGKWFDYLRQNNLYDNARIIIVSDHGYHAKLKDEFVFSENMEDDYLLYNPLLLVKDFDSNEFNIDNSFMTNADVPTIATEGLIKNPRNPLTNKIINSVSKLNEKQYISLSHLFNIDKNNGTKFLPSEWVTVHDNIFDINNWEKVEGKE